MSYFVYPRTVSSIRVFEIDSKSCYQANRCGACNNWKSTTYGALQYSPSAPSTCYNEQATFLCHGNHTAPCSDSNASLMGLLLALTVHSVLEGLAIGLQKLTAEVCYNRYLISLSFGTLL